MARPGRPSPAKKAKAGSARCSASPSRRVAPRRRPRLASAGRRRYHFAAMLIGLSIRDVVLIDRLDLSFRPGLCVLTGETGAGKSILLDALGLALGVRAESGLVRRGAEQASVSAEFSLPSNHPARVLVRESGIAIEDDTLVLRRVVAGDGRSRAFIADQPVSVTLLRQVGEALVEIEAQFAQRGLLDPATHREALDAYGVAAADLRGLGDAWRAWRAAVAEHDAAAARLKAAQAEEEFLRHAIKELEALDPKPGEETTLADERTLMQNRERLTEALEAALAELAGERGGGRDRGAAPCDRRRCRAARADRGTAVRVARAGTQAQCPGRWARGLACRDCRQAHRARGWWRRGRGPEARRRRRSQRLYRRGGQGLDRAPRCRRQARPGGDEGAEAAQARKSALHHGADRARRSRMGAAWLRARPFRGRDQSRRARRAARQGGVGRRALALHAGSQGGAGAHLAGADAGLRRGRQRHRRRGRGRGGRAPASPRPGAPGPGRHPLAAGGGPRHPSLD